MTAMSPYGRPLLRLRELTRISLVKYHIALRRCPDQALFRFVANLLRKLQPDPDGVTRALGLAKMYKANASARHKSSERHSRIFEDLVGIVYVSAYF